MIFAFEKNIIRAGIVAGVLAMAGTFAFCGGGKPQSSSSSRPVKLKKHISRFYVIYTDLEPAIVRQVKVHLDSMNLEYARRTKGFSGKIEGKMPFYLFSRREDYYTLGGMTGTLGLYDGRKLMAVAVNGVNKGSYER